MATQRRKSPGGGDGIDIRDPVVIPEINIGTVPVALIGTSPLILNRMSEKAQQQLLWPKERINKAAYEQSQKQNPIEEFRSSVYRSPNQKSPTLLLFPSGGFKKSLVRAATDIPGATGAAIGRLTWIVESDVAIYGRPMLFMSVVRNSGINKTPAIRTRAILPEWAAVFHLRYVSTILNQENIGRLLAAAGLIIGLGDGRQEKGWGSFGQFELADEKDARLLKLIKSGGRSVQESAMATPQCYDATSEELLSWFEKEYERRKPKQSAPHAAAATRGRKTNGKDEYRVGGQA